MVNIHIENAEEVAHILSLTNKVLVFVALTKNAYRKCHWSIFCDVLGFPL